jgi:hypothetical protein
MLYQFQQLDSSDPQYTGQIKQIWESLSQHIKEEEETDLPQLEKALHDMSGESDKLASSFERTKYFVPTRSHPAAGENPLFESVAGLLAAPVDKLADMFRKFPQK